MLVEQIRLDKNMPDTAGLWYCTSGSAGFQPVGFTGKGGITRVTV